MLACILLLAACSSSGNYDKFNGSFSTEGFSKDVLALGDLAKPYRGGRYKVGAPYTINGITYSPEEDFGYDETGIASWYGPGFHARATANGEEFDQDQLTAAHKTLPMPCFVRVTNLDNGRKIVVRVNDRGPYAEGRIIDLSRASATALGFKNIGLARVRVEVMTDETRRMADFMKSEQGNNRAYASRKPSRVQQTQQAMAAEAGVIVPTAPPPAIAQESLTPVQAAPVRNEKIRNAKIQTASISRPDHVAAVSAPVPAVPDVSVTEGLADSDPGQKIFIQAGAFSNQANALRLKQRLDQLGQVDIVPTQTANGSMYRVRVGPMQDEQAARSALEAAHAAGVNDARMVMAFTSVASAVKD